MSTEHVAERPSWDCGACGKPWPCDPAREALAVETGGGTVLAIQCCTYLEDFVRDHGSGPPAETFERFIGWTRSLS